jgi:tetratricopeptide (TPR) repeat protein
VLTQETAYASLLLSRRREIHRRVAECLKRTEPDNVIALARHYMEARQPEQAFPYFVQAGDRAARSHAAHEAITHYSRALDAAEQSDQRALHVRSARGHAYEIVGDFEAAQADFEAVLQVAREQGDHRSEWQALLDLGYLWASRDYDKTGNYYHQALERARAMNEPAVIADSLNRVGNWYVNDERPRTGTRFHQEALEIWETLGDLRGTVYRRAFASPEWSAASIWTTTSPCRFGCR